MIRRAASAAAFIGALGVVSAAHAQMVSCLWDSAELDGPSKMTVCLHDQRTLSDADVPELFVKSSSGKPILIGAAGGDFWDSNDSVRAKQRPGTGEK